MAEKLETRSELFKCENSTNLDNAKNGFAYNSDHTLVVTIDYPSGLPYTKIQVDLMNKQQRMKTVSGSWTSWV